MKKFYVLALCLLSFCGLKAHAAHPFVYQLLLKTGTYDFISGNINEGPTFCQGSIIIAPQGKNYVLYWKKQNSTALFGTGTFNAGVLTVTYFDRLARENKTIAFTSTDDGNFITQWPLLHGRGTAEGHLIWKNASLN